jgi:hypothetical protein
MTTTRNAIALSSVGNGAKLHIVEVKVGEPTTRFGREVQTYDQPAVYCGSDRGWGNHAHGVTELARFEYPAFVDGMSREERNNIWLKYHEAHDRAVLDAVAELETYADRICAKCLASHTKLVERIASRAMSDDINAIL